MKGASNQVGWAAAGLAAAAGAGLGTAAGSAVDAGGTTADLTGGAGGTADAASGATTRAVTGAMAGGATGGVRSQSRSMPISRSQMRCKGLIRGGAGRGTASMGLMPAPRPCRRSVSA